MSETKEIKDRFEEVSRREILDILHLNEIPPPG